MEFLKNVNVKILKKSLIGIILSVLFLYAGVFIYSYTFEQDKIAIDKYNFEQLEKVKSFLDNKKEYSFKNLTDFNNKYNLELLPKENCYYFESSNNFEYPTKSLGYILGFKLESLKYKLLKLNWYIAYPEYNIPPHVICYGMGNAGCSNRDINYEYFIETISNPCQD